MMLPVGPNIRSVIPFSVHFFQNSDNLTGGERQVILVSRVIVELCFYFFAHLPSTTVHEFELKRMVAGLRSSFPAVPASIMSAVLRHELHFVRDFQFNAKQQMRSADATNHFQRDGTYIYKLRLATLLHPSWLRSLLSSN